MVPFCGPPCREIVLLYGWFNILNRLGMIHECDRQTDGRTNILVVINVAFNYVARTKSTDFINAVYFISCKQVLGCVTWLVMCVTTSQSVKVKVKVNVDLYSALL